MTEAPTTAPAAGGRRVERTRRLAAERAAVAVRARRRQRLTVGLVAGVVVAVTVGIGVGVQASRDGAARPSGDPAGVTDGGILSGPAAAPVTVTVYEDFLCPACRAADERLSGAYAALVEAGEIRLERRPIAILDGYSSDRYSTRALNAAACVVDSTPSAFPAFHSALFADQPAEGGPGLTDDRLVELAEDAGAPGQQSCIADLRFEDWTRRTTDAASRAGVNATPTILVGGAPLQEWSAQALATAVDAARAAG